MAKGISHSLTVKNSYGIIKLLGVRCWVGLNLFTLNNFSYTKSVLTNYILITNLSSIQNTEYRLAMSDADVYLYSVLPLPYKPPLRILKVIAFPENNLLSLFPK